VTLEIQALTMLHMAGAGVYLGAAFDVFSRLRIKKSNRWLIMIQDLMFWLVNGLLIFIWLRLVNEGEMRIYIFLSLFCGYALYKALLQNIFRDMLERWIKMTLALYRFILHILHVFVIKPLQWLYKIIIALVLFVVGLIIQILNYFYRLILFLIKPIGFLFTNWWKRVQEKRKQKNKDKNEALDGDEKKGILVWMAKWLFRK
jgi:spore cortex biosynthesis protein YabQ